MLYENLAIIACLLNLVDLKIVIGVIEVNEGAKSECGTQNEFVKKAEK